MLPVLSPVSIFILSKVIVIKVVVSIAVVSNKQLKHSCSGHLGACILNITQPKAHLYTQQGTLVEGEGSVPLTSTSR